MSNEHLSRLKLDRGTQSAMVRRARWMRVLKWLLLAGIAGAGMVAYQRWQAKLPIAVEVAVISQVYPSVAQTQLNATGYVVAQRKAAVASKATGRLEWLGVREGSVVKQGEVLARLENRDVVAAQQQAEANVALARANLDQAVAELNDAGRALERSRDLLAKNFVSAAAHDTVVARHEKAKAGIKIGRAHV